MGVVEGKWGPRLVFIGVMLHMSVRYATFFFFFFAVKDRKRLIKRSTKSKRIVC